MKRRALIAVVVLTIGVSQLHAATITVTSSNDSGPGSLRDALANAADGDTITVAAHGTILLTSGELLITRSINVVGPGPDRLEIDGNALARVFHVAPSSTVNISSLTITNGSAQGGFPDYHGGGIYNEASSLTIWNCVLSGNTAGVDGGGINVAGGYHGRASLVVINSTLNGNSAGSDGSGGGIFSYFATVRMVNSTLRGNSASVAGGAVCSDGAAGGVSLIVTDCILNANSATEGAAISCSVGFDRNSNGGAAAAQVANCTLDSNSAYSHGGGIVNDHSSLSVSECSFEGNTAGFYGGGIWNLGDDTGTSTVKICGCTFASNSAGRLGGGIDNDGNSGGYASLSLINCTLSGNSAFSGGGICNDGDSGGNAVLNIANSTLTANLATNGGTIYNDASSDGAGVGRATLTIANTILDGSSGSGVTISSSLGIVTSAGCNLSSDDGGGFLTAMGDQTNTDPVLGPLQDNGGPTYTCALLPGSPAINAGDPHFLPPPYFDQRGRRFSRIVCARIDIGAFELQNGACANLIEQVDALITLVQTFDLRLGTAHSFIAALHSVDRALERENVRVACGKLRTFLHKVNAENGKKLTAPQADALASRATAIRAALVCP